MTTVGELKEICEKILDQISWWDDDTVICTHTSTYGLGYTILETCDGFIDYSDIQEDEEDYYED